MELPKSEQDALIVAHMDYARRGAFKHWYRSGRSVDIDDLIGTAYVGLVRAGRAFNPSIGVKFSTFVFRCVSQELWKESRNERHLNGWTYYDESQADGRVKRKMRLIAPRVEWPIDADGNQMEFVGPLVDFVEDILRARARTLILESARDSRMRALLQWRLEGVQAFVIAERLGVSTQRVNQLEHEAIRRARAYVRGKGWAYYDDDTEQVGDSAVSEAPSEPAR